MSDTGKETPTMVEEIDQTQKNDTLPELSLSDEEYQPYHMSWRTGVAVFSLAVLFGVSTFAITGPNFAISNMVETFPAGAKNAVWIADAGLVAAVSIPNMVGPTSDRYGKKWFLVIGPIIALVGAVVAGKAKNLNIIIGGQAIGGLGSSLAIVAIPAGMEVVPAKYRPMVFAIMATFNGLLGAVAGPFVFAACIEHQIGGINGWRWGFYIQAILFGIAAIGILVSYNPPPTRWQREQDPKELWKSIDFVGIGILTTGFVITLLPLVWAGSIYPWKSSQVIAMLVVGPVVCVIFGLYEWKARSDGILNHAFFESRNFPILLALGFVDGMLLYGLSEFVPNEIRSLYTIEPLHVAHIFGWFGGMLCIGFLAIGIVVTKLKRFHVPIMVTNGLTTLIAGLLSRATPHNQNFFTGMLVCLGLLTAANTVVPVGGIALVVPPQLLGTSNLILSVVRVIGGILGLTIFQTVYNNKAAVIIPAAIVPFLIEAGFPQPVIPEIIEVVLQSPSALGGIPAIPPQALDQILALNAQASAECYKYVWYCITAVSGACFISTLFLQDVPERMTNQVEIVLEIQENLTKESKDEKA
ncbi:MFS general substrate transporter [Hyaloscypha hepaticicola]|uniref:MFS general substrate transporter n=1 Tax=Hyaloscypha hepaticicola TaxID=2082293 RepID=A0A2J6Q807_9HELO|nr:MFS general substrate transporter [Hyaloscypha hepaticicola]